MLFPGFIVNWLTFPGVIIHEFAHKKMCDWRGILVSDVQYFSLSGSGYVDHARPYAFGDAWAISGAPFFVNTLLAVALYAIAGVVYLSARQNPDATWVSEIGSPLLFIIVGLGWLGFSIGVHAIPSYADVGNIWRAVKVRWNESVLAFLSIPLAALLFLMSWLKFFWFDFIYSAILAVLSYIVIAVLLAPESLMAA